MDFNLIKRASVGNDEEELYDITSCMIVSKNKDIDDSEFNKVVQIIDESGQEVTCTFDKFVEIFDQEGLSGFII